MSTCGMVKRTPLCASVVDRLPCDWDCPVDALADLLGGPQAYRILATVAAKAGLPPKSSRRSWAASFKSRKIDQDGGPVSDELEVVARF
jgi:hypothetical protein